MKLNIFIGLVAVSLTAATARAQNFGMSWFTFDGGGGSSAGGSFSLNGTIGQPDASAPMSGGGFTVSGGFWPGVTGPVPSGSPDLRIELVAPFTVRLAWPAAATGYVLQGSPTVAGPGPVWTDVGTAPVVVGSERQVTLPAAGIGRYFRLRGP